MPERPDLEHVVPVLAERLVGRAIVGARLKKPVVLRAPVALDTIVGATVRDVTRLGHFVVLDLGEWTLAINLMLAGRFTFAAAGARDTADLALAWDLGGEELRLRDDQQMAKVYLVRDVAEVPGLLPVGDDVLADTFTRARLGERAKKRREQAKVWLMDKHTFDSFGNAYADETLWAAGIHPKATVSTLTPEQLDRLWHAMRTVLGEARDTIRARNPPIDEKVRDFLKVRNRAGEACPRCGGKIRAAGVHGHDAFFCPVCQPDVAGKGFVGWRR